MRLSKGALCTRNRLPLLVLLLAATPVYAAGEKIISTSCSSDQNAADFDAIAQCNGSTFQAAPIILGPVANPPYSGITCNSGKAGMLQYDGTSFQGCNGTAWGGLVGTIATASYTAQTADIAATTLFTPVANTYFRPSCVTTVSVAATTSSTLPQCNVIWTDVDSNVTITKKLVNTDNANNLGTTGAVGTTAPLMIYAKSGTAIQFSTSGYASSGATAMQYAVRVKLEVLP